VPDCSSEDRCRIDVVRKTPGKWTQSIFNKLYLNANKFQLDLDLMVWTPGNRSLRSHDDYEDRKLRDQAARYDEYMYEQFLKEKKSEIIFIKLTVRFVRL
jgi:hypothetical protein